MVLLEGIWSSNINYLHICTFQCIDIRELFSNWFPFSLVLSLNAGLACRESARRLYFTILIRTYFVCREKNVSHVMRIPDVEVSKVFDMQLKLLNPAPVEWSAGFSQFLFSPSQTQCNIEFDKERRQFFISDVGSRNGTFLNGCRLSEVNYTYFYLQGHGITENCILESIYNLEKTTGSKMKEIYFRGISSQWQCGCDVS